ncbi:MAG: glycosyltransferase family 4 protein [Ruminococcus sp.]|nr:glycosyltransferase family 4 protein [Ruminococcus sp.]
MDVKHNTYNIQEVGLAKALIRRGHVCDIVFWTDNNEENVSVPVDKEHSITVYYRKGKNILKNAIFNDISDLIPQYDILQPCEYNQIQAWILAKKYPNKTVIYHGPYYSDFNKGYNKICKLFDTFFLRTYKKLNTQFIVKSKLAEKFLRSKELKNVKTIGVGIDLSALTSSDEKVPEFIESIKRKPDTVNLLYIGRFEPRRNIPFIYEVAKQLKDKGQKIQLIMVGKGDSEYVQMCEQKARELGVNRDIIKTERLEQKYLSKLYEKCDFFLLPTHYEIFGMVLLEAMYYGLTCLTTENGGSDMLIEDGKDGFVLPLDTEKWAETVMNNKVKEIGCSAHQKIADKYTWDALAGKFEDVYQCKLNY